MLLSGTFVLSAPGAFGSDARVATGLSFRPTTMRPAKVALAAVVGLSLAHASWSFQAPRPLLQAGGAARRAAAEAPARAARALRRLSLPKAPRARAPRLQMAREAAPGPAVGEMDMGGEMPMTAAQIAEEEARRQVSEVVEIMMGEMPATMAPAPIGSLPPRLWVENVDALLNEPVYKSVMYQRLESCSSEQELMLLEVRERERERERESERERVRVRVRVLRMCVRAQTHVPSPSRAQGHEHTCNHLHSCIASISWRVRVPGCAGGR